MKARLAELQTSDSAAPSPDHLAPAMTSSSMTALHRLPCRLLPALLTSSIALLAACGGSSDTEVSRSDIPEAITTAESPVAMKTVQSAQATPSAPGTLTVRAYASLSSGVGAMMTVRVNGVDVGTQRVDSTVPADYVFSVPTLAPGSKIDVAYTNNTAAPIAVGEDRNLHIVQLTSGSTAALPGPTNATIDRGAGSSAFDGVDTLPGSGNLFSDAALRLTWPQPNLLDSRLTVRASAVSAGGVGARMVVRVDGIVVGSTEVTATAPTDYVYIVPAYTVGSRVDVAFTNAGSSGGLTRTLNVHYVINGTTVLLPTSSSVKFDAGSGVTAFDGVNQSAGQVALTSNGALRGAWPAANMTDSLTVRASGSMVAGIGPVMQVLVDGVVVGNVEVRSTTPADIAFPTLPLRPGAQVDIAFTNDALVGSEDRNLTVAYAIAGTTVLRPTDVGVIFDAGSGAAAFDGASTSAGRTTLTSNGALRGTWPATNLTDSLIVRARGTPSAGVWPTMQVLVDGVLVGSAQVNSSAYTDFRFAVPPMSPGRKLDIAYTNNVVAPLQTGEDRNLFVAYATTANTVWLPNAAGAVFDRGAGAAAFDGADVIAPTGSLYWDGALRATWPTANITTSVVVRASGTLAGNVGPQMILWVDGVAVSSVEVRSTTSADYTMPTTALRPGSKVAVTFANRGTADGAARALNVQYLIAGSTFLTPTSPGTTYSSGDLSGTWPSPNITDTLTVRAYANVAGGVGAVMQVRVDGVVVATQEVRSTTPADYRITVAKLNPGSRIDLVYINDGRVNGVDRNLYVQYIKTGNNTLVTYTSNVVFDDGVSDEAYDGVGTSFTGGALYANGSLRFTVPAVSAPATAAQLAASHFLQLASFGPTSAEIHRVAQIGAPAWIDEQIAMPFTADMVPAVQSRYDLGDAYRPGGAQYNTAWVGQRFWAAAATSPDQLRRRVGFALHKILMVSQADANLFPHTRAYAQYIDNLNRHALGNYRTLLEQMALSPVMGTYLSHIRNRPEDPAVGRMPDENFAREVLQLFTIGLHELNQDGTPKLDGRGMPIDTYTNDDVMALSKVFTGWSWAFPDNQLTENVFRYSSPDYSVVGDTRIDLQPMKAYPGLHSTAEKRLFTGKPHAVVIPAGGSAQTSLRTALDALFNHPNTGPFIGRQLIQHLVSSHPSPAYVGRVAAVFANNGRGVRGDLAAVVRAILLDPEAQTPPNTSIGKLREPVMRVSHWMRSLEATSSSGQYPIVSDVEILNQRPLFAPSVFGYFRPGYVPPNTTFSAESITVPEMQIVSESTTAQWVNVAQRMAGSGIGWTGSTYDVVAPIQPLADLAASGQVNALIERLNLLLYAGRMSATLKQDMLEAMISVGGSDAASHTNRARVALFLALASPEFLVQR